MESLTLTIDDREFWVRFEAYDEEPNPLAHLGGLTVDIDEAEADDGGEIDDRELDRIRDEIARVLEARRYDHAW